MTDHLHIPVTLNICARPSAFGWLVVAGVQVGGGDWTESTHGPFATEAETLAAVARIKSEMQAVWHPSTN